MKFRKGCGIYRPAAETLFYCLFLPILKNSGCSEKHIHSTTPQAIKEKIEPPGKAEIRELLRANQK
jgi:hypothetical protein